METHSPERPTESVLLDRYPGFQSFKTTTPIHYPRRWIRDALIQASLDRDVTALAPSITADTDLPRPAEFSFRLYRNGALRLVLLTQAPSSLGKEIDDDRIVVWNRTMLTEGSRAKACGAVWAHKRSRIDPADLYRATELVNRCGAVPVARLLRALRSPDIDPLHQVFHYLANGYLTADLAEGIAPSTMVSTGPCAWTG